MLDATLANTQPTQWQLDGEASENGDTVEAWFTFKTAIASGKGYLRLINGKCWTLLTTMQALDDFPEPRNHHRPKGAEHGANKQRETWLEAASGKKRSLVTRASLTA